MYIGRVFLKCGTLNSFIQNIDNCTHILKFVILYDTAKYIHKNLEFFSPEKAKSLKGKFHEMLSSDFFHETANHGSNRCFLKFICFFYVFSQSYSK